MDTKKKQWSDLSPGTRRAISVGALIDVSLRAIAIIDLIKRPQEEIKGSKALWAVALVVVGSAGLVPTAYLTWARRD